MNFSKLFNELMMKNKLNRVYLIAFISLSLFSTSSKLLATECYDEFRKSCIQENGVPYLRDKFDCNMNEQVFSKTMYDDFDSWSYIDIDRSIADEMRGVTNTERSGGKAANFRFGVCYYETLKKYRQTGLRPNTNQASTQSSSSGSSNQSNQKANQQSANNQSSSDDERKKKLNEAIDQFNSAHNQKDYAKAIPALQIIINSQDKHFSAVATSRLAEYYKFGFGVPKDEIKAHELFKRASAAGHTDADGFICEDYMNGTGGVTENHQTALKYCTSSANNGKVSSMAILGWLYSSGTGTQNVGLAKEWTCKAANKGDAIATRNAEKLKLNCN